MTFYSGQRLSAAILNAAFPLKAVKTGDQAITSNATPQDDDHLFVTVRANTSYLVFLTLFWTSTSNTPDFRNMYEGPTGATMPARAFFAQPNAATGATGDMDTNVTTAISTEDGRGAINGSVAGFQAGTLVVGGTAGIFRLKWAQITSDPAAVTLETGSHMLLIPV